MACIIEPAINVYSREEYQRRIASLGPQAEMLQFDVIDGIFARPGNYNNPRLVEKNLESGKIDLHFMVMDIDKELERWLPIKPRRIILHVEHPGEISRYFRILEKNNVQKGLAVAPFTPLKKIIAILKEIDYLLLLSVTPGGSGQEFFSTTAERVKTVRSGNPALTIGVDGGVREEHLLILKNSGANNIVVGSALFNGNERERYRIFSELVKGE